MRILLTGFEPFGGRERNLSWEAVSALRCDGVRTECLPVSFTRAPKQLVRLMDEYQPQVLLMFGLSSKRDKVTVERVAINVMDSICPDNDGCRPIDEPVSPEGETAYLATLPIKDIVESLNESGIQASVSNSAGTYVCNAAMYSALKHIDETQQHCIAGFIHLPDMSLDKAIATIETTIKTLFIS